jgi:diguanylate cyclase (GGDEF)-like protein
VANKTKIAQWTERPNILIVDDKPENLIALEALLEECNATITPATSGNDALNLALENEFALVLLDVQMPEMDGFEVAELLRSNASTQHFPIIFITATDDKQYIFKGYASGAVDYLSKPIEPIILKSKVTVFINLWQQQHALANALSELEEAHKKIEVQKSILQERSIRDHLTGLYQRRWFDTVTAKEASLAIRHCIPLSLAMIDIDHFKQVNDSHGHIVGDAVLVRLAKLLEESIRVEDVLFRFGGEEFVVLMPNTNIASASSLCNRICQTVAKRAIEHEGQKHNITVSIGLAELLELTKPTTHTLLETADNLLYQAKAEGRNRVVTTSVADNEMDYPSI